MDMIEGFVSVITPMYNADKYIGETIESVIAQTYMNWEMIIVDDCSGDSCADIVKQYCEKDNRVHYYRNESNSGVAMTRNRAISYAKGQYIAFLDSDDIWKPDKLEKQLQLMKDTGSSFCYGSCSVMNQDGQNMKKDRIVPVQIDYKKLLMGNVIPCLTVVIDRKQIPDIQMPQIPHEDYAAWLSILRDYQITACGVTDIVALYREGMGSVSSKKGQAAKWTFKIYRDYLGLSITESIWCFVNYVWNAVKKRI